MPKIGHFRKIFDFFPTQKKMPSVNNIIPAGGKEMTLSAIYFSTFFPTGGSSWGPIHGKGSRGRPYHLKLGPLHVKAGKGFGGFKSHEFSKKLPKMGLWGHRRRGKSILVVLGRFLAHFFGAKHRFFFLKNHHEFSLGKWIFNG